MKFLSKFEQKMLEPYGFDMAYYQIFRKKKLFVAPVISDKNSD